jgi:hypothetical protein
MRRALRYWSAALALGVITVMGGSAVFVSPALAETTAESDCVALIGGGVYGGNYSNTAACERDVKGLTDFNIGGVNTGGAFGGHLEFDYFGTTSNFLGATYGEHATGVTISNPPTCITGSVTTTFWRHNSDSSYTDMGQATINIYCDVANPPPPPGGYVVTEVPLY